MRKLIVYAAGAASVAAGAGLSAPAAANAWASRAPAAKAHHVVPFGVKAARSARRGAARSVTTRPAPASTVTEWVSGTATVGGDTSCSDPGFSTISAALTAAPAGATVEVCAGTYTEQLAITKSVSLVAVGPVTVVLPATPADNLTVCDADGGAQPNQDIVDICGPVSVGMTGFTIQGAWPTNVCNDSLYGVAVLGGADLTMSHSTVTGAGGDPMTDGCQGGVGIEVGLTTSATTADAGKATLSHVLVTAYQKNGITVDGSGSSAVMSHVTVRGAGATPAIAQNGIQVSDGAVARITGSTVSGDECDDTAANCGPNGFSQVQSVGILLFDAGKTQVSGTTVTASDIGVYNLEDYPWSYYTPPTPFTPVVQHLSGLTLANRYENAYFDEGVASLTSSRSTGGEIGVEVAQWSGQATHPGGRVTGTTILGASTAAVQVASDQVAGDERVKFQVLHSKFANSDAGGVENQSTSIIAATRDWWGSATGPSVWSFGSGTSVSPDVNFFPWARNAKRTRYSACTVVKRSKATTGNRVVLCAKPGTSAVRLANSGHGDVLLIGNGGNDRLIGSRVGGMTWIIGGTRGANKINGRGGAGYIQERGDKSDVLSNTSRYTVAAS